MLLTFRTALLALVAVGSGCSLERSARVPEGGVDAGADTSTGEAGADSATSDAAMDAADGSVDVAVPDAVADGSTDATPDATPDAPSCTPWSFTPANVDPCASPTMLGTVSLTPGTYVYDTNTGNLTGAPSPPSTLDTTPDPDLRIVWLDGLDVQAGATLRVVGRNPVAFVVFGDAQVSGTIDVSAFDSGMGWAPGAGAEQACSVGDGGNAPSSSDGAGGGGGGGFGQPGGDGGNGDGVGHGAGGGVEGDASLSPLRGGCPGGRGGSGDVAASGGLRGRGGGAVQISARDTLTVTGSIRASGGPGIGGKQADSGGGGGGSGGGILLEASTVTIGGSGEVCANGGGGGGGASDPTVRPGGDGELGSCSDSSGAAGGDAGSGGSRGGAGGYAGGVAETGRSADEGGGGGGGAVGRVRIRSASSPVLDGTISPAPG